MFAPPQSTQVYKPVTAQAVPVPDRLSVSAPVPVQAVHTNSAPAPVQDHTVSAPAAETPVAEMPAGETDLQAFKMRVREYVDVEAQLQQLAKQSKALRERRVELQEDICVFMGDNEIGDLHTREMRLQLKTVTAKIPLKQAEVRQRIEEFFGGAGEAAPFFEKVYDDRATVQKTQLKKLKPRA